MKPNPPEDWLDAALEASPAVPDDGFTDSVVARLPRRPARALPRGAVAAALVALAAVALAVVLPALPRPPTAVTLLESPATLGLWTALLLTLGWVPMTIAFD